MICGVNANANVCVEVCNARTGRTLRRIRRHNLVVTAGLKLLRDIVYGDTATLSHGAVGTDATPTVAGDVALVAEVFRDQLGQRAKQPYDLPSLVLRFIVGSQDANGSTLREAGLFNAASPGEGSMYARVVLGEDVVKTDAILVIITWTLTWAAA
jgi:hypothetical protein